MTVLVQRFSLVMATIVVLLKMTSVTANFNLTVEVGTLLIPGNQLANGSCCEDVSSIENCSSSCQNVVVRFCLSEVNSSDCFLWESVRGVTAQTNGSSVVVSSLEENALPVSTGVQLTLVVFRNDNETEQLIDTFSIHINLTANQPPTLTTYEGDLGVANLSLLVEVSCSSNYYNPDCNVYCVSSNDSTGYYGCNETDGSIICLEGYTNTSLNCTQCVPAQGCSVMGGYCDLPGDCLCYPGYTGTNCETDLLSTSILSPTIVQTPSSIVITQTTSISTTNPSPPMSVSKTVSLSTSRASMFVLSPTTTSQVATGDIISSTTNTLSTVTTSSLYLSSSVTSTPLLSPSVIVTGNGQQGAVIAGAVIGTIIGLVAVVAVITLVLVLLLRNRGTKTATSGVPLWYIKTNPSARGQKISYVSDTDGGNHTQSLRSLRSLTPDFLVVRHKQHKSTVPNGGGQFLNVPAVTYNMDTSSKSEQTSPDHRWFDETDPTLSSDDTTLPRNVRSPSAETDCTHTPGGGTSTAASSLSRVGQNLKVYQMPSFENDSIILTNMGVEEEMSGDVSQGENNNTEQAANGQAKINSKSL